MSDYRQTLAELLAAPRDFLHGLIGGLVAPILALAGAVGLLYLLTNKLPAITEVTRTNGDREKTIVLASQTQARASWARHSGELRGALLDAKASKKAA